jgi:uncharacterized protein
MVKRIVVLLWVIPLLLTGTKALSANLRIFDQAALLTEEEVQTLDGKVEELSTKTKLDVAIVTTNDTTGKSARNYADDFYDDNGFGIGENYDGLLFLIDMDHREVYISTCGRAIEIFTDERIDAMTDTSISYLAEQDYVGAVHAFLDDVQFYAENESEIGENQSGNTNQDSNSSVAEKRNSIPTVGEIFVYAIIALVAGGIFCVITYSHYRSPKYNPPYPFNAKGELDLISQEDTFINQYITQQRIPDSTSHSSGRSGGSSTHVSRSGRTHGGGGKRF